MPPSLRTVKTTALGRPSFFFPGRACKDVQEFKRDIRGDTAKDTQKPNFFSRLPRYIDILGPNNQAYDYNGSSDDDDIYSIRRVTLLHSLPQRVEGKLAVEEPLRNRLLSVQDFPFRSYSVESMLSMGSVCDRKFY